MDNLKHFNRNVKRTMFFSNKRADVWVSTVIYTLIGLAIMGVLLSVVNPKIQEMKDSFTVKQTIVALGDFDDVIQDIVQKGAANKRLYELHLSEGNFMVDCENNALEWNLPDSKYMASEPSKPGEPEKPYESGNIIITTVEQNDVYSVTLKIDYSYLDFTFGEEQSNEKKTLQPASTPYSLYLENKGSYEGLRVINIQLK